MSPNRIVAVATALLGVVAAISVPLANLDWSSTAGVIAGLGAVALAALKWLDGWQQYEQQQVLYGPSSALNTQADVSWDPEEEGDNLHPDFFDVDPTDPATIKPDVGDSRAKNKGGA